MQEHGRLLSRGYSSHFAKQ